jgi:hypothetical protein
VRPLETVLIVANVGAFVVLVAPLRGRARWLRYTAVIPLLVIGTHLLAEGPRWQMIPAYARGGLIFLAGLAWPLRYAKPAGSPVGRTRSRRSAAVAGIGLGVLGLAISTALPIILPVFRFPDPTGPNDIGTLTYHWVDAGRSGPCTQHHQRLYDCLFQPAPEGPAGVPARRPGDAIPRSTNRNPPAVKRTPGNTARTLDDVVRVGVNNL